MEFMSRGVRPNQTTAQSEASPAATTHKKSKLKTKMDWTQIAGVGFLFALTILVVAVIAAISMGGKGEANNLDKSKFQAVFLNGGQVYFGKVDDLNKNFLKLDNIYYLRVNQQVQPDGNAGAGQNDISLVKLGCELHGPQDSMVINREQVIFWENLKDDGQVAKAVANYKEQNPGEQKCETSSSSSESNTGTTNNSNTNSTPTTGTGTGTGGANSNNTNTNRTTR